MKTKYLILPLLGLLVSACSGPSSSTSDDPSTSSPTSVSEETPSNVDARPEIDGTALNAYFGRDVYSLIPAIQSDDYDFFDNSSEDYPVDIYVDLFDWDEDDMSAYDSALSVDYTIDDYGNYQLDENLFILGVYDEETYDVPVYSLNIYTVAEFVIPDDPTPKDEIDGSLLNAFFTKDIYSLIPEIYSEDYEFFDNASDEYPIDVFIDLFDWDAADEYAYAQALDAAFTLDEVNGYVIEENLFIYTYLDDVSYDIPVYGINIYSIA